MSEPEYTLETRRTRTQTITHKTNTCVTIMTRDDADGIEIDINARTYSAAIGSFLLRDMNVARELATAINQSADWVESGKPVPVAKPTPPTPEPKETTNIEWVGFLLMWGGACAIAGAAVGKVLL